MKPLVLHINCCFTIADDTSSTQIIGGGYINHFSTANQIQSVVTPQDTLTLSFPNDVTIPNNLTALEVHIL
ncbi:MAG: hypothetical protein CM15mV8_0300 [Caudoviricetes sp.]|nr:MAG: hypothetical protein CM15mV8_0300 [Caudoviricetes sp.]